MRILIAEDEKDLRLLLRMNLAEEGYDVLEAPDGLAAWNLLQHEKIDLALLDVMMPGLDGLNLLCKLREISDMPVIMLTARGEEMDKVLGLNLGADDYLAKPFGMAELMARIAARLRRRRDHAGIKYDAATILKAGSLTIDKEGCTACLNRNALELSAKEYMLLCHLMENPGRVFTKRQLYQAVWDEDTYYDDNTIMVHISRLRSKIEADAKNPAFIQTVRGIGYRFCVDGGTKP
jgi:DNA-binding response OmpR family regulator